MQIGKGKSGVLITESNLGNLNIDILNDAGLEAVKRFKSDRNPILGGIKPACDNPGWQIYFTAKGDLVVSLRDVNGKLKQGDLYKGQAGKKTKS